MGMDWSYAPETSIEYHQAGSDMEPTRQKKKRPPKEHMAKGPPGRNVAEFAETIQSSTLQRIYTADRAVDGNTGKKFFQDTCAHTSCNDHDPHWTVCLQQQHTINSITIHNPDKARGRLKNIKIEVFQTNPRKTGAIAQLCAAIGPTPALDGTSVTLLCPNGTRGQYIRISKTVMQQGNWWQRGRRWKNNKCDALLLCEVEVVGTPYVDCPKGFERFQDSCYHFSDDDDVESWFQARISCQTIGADLAVIESKDENDFIAAKILALAGNNNNWSFFAGLHKLNDQMTWMWIDPNAVMGVPSGQPNALNPFSDWRDGQGDDTDDQHCLTYFKDNLKFTWDHDECCHSHRYICEISPTFPQPRCRGCFR
ncbi:uncharacterized protein LOC121386012 [Gigantopelta aegis]|uniref:uncharacterized protein LOC121386012 n=1 Tax=Gigantopelta aegis TaxID=1735272 RepID=UPI001B889BC2|nr:uncharacterized protein LOC121386012 [Gigantopelta aegis]